MASRSKPLAWRGERDPAFLEAIEPRRGVERAIDVLLDDDERRALGGDRVSQA